MSTKISTQVDFSKIRYAQCWEDADILLQALAIQPGHICLSIASAGDNTLAMLSRGPAKVIALDLNPAQLACLELRVAAYRQLSHAELLELLGSTPSQRRQGLYRRCRNQLSAPVQAFWDARPTEIDQGIGAIGKFEHYFSLFRRYVLPLIHSRRYLTQLLAGDTLHQRQNFYQHHWNNWRWQLLFRLFFSRWLMGRLGRDPAFFQFVEGNVAARILARTEHALTVLNPADNPYLQWIIFGRHLTALPYALRPENFEAIRANLDRLEWHEQSIEDFLDRPDCPSIDRYNLSDIFEYMPLESYHHLLQRLVQAGRRGSRLAYWNMLAPRSRPDCLAGQLHPLPDLAQKLHLADKAFFYSNFIVEEVS